VLKDQYGVSASKSGYYDFKNRTQSVRALRDKYLKERIPEIYEQNYSCYGVRKVWRKLLEDNPSVARCTVERLMRELSIGGVVRGNTKVTTIAAKNAMNVDDLVKREFHADAPNKLWVADFTYVSTWEGWCYTAFVMDAFSRRILGWSCSSLMNQKLVSNAFRNALFARTIDGVDDFNGLIHHNDKGSQYTSNDFMQLLALHGIRVSIGSVGDSFDNALAETLNGTYKTELIKNKGPWKNLEKLKLETARWVHWYNTQRISEYNNWNAPIEIEKMWYSNGIDARKAST
jgi:putative transposase